MSHSLTGRTRLLSGFVGFWNPRIVNEQENNQKDQIIENRMENSLKG